MNTQSENVAERADGDVDDPTAVPSPDPFDPANEDDLADDLDFAPTARSGLGKVTVGLLAGIALVAAFGGGVYVQKQQAPTAGAGAPAAFAGRGMGAGGFPGAEGGTGAGAVGGTGTGTGTGTASGTSSTAATPAVIGTVVKVSGNTVTVKNFAGKTVKVTVPDGVSVTKSQTVTADDLESGASVTVTGTTAADGSVTATGVTAR